MRQVSFVVLLILGFTVGGCSIFERTKLTPVAVIEVIPQQGSVPLDVRLNGEFSRDFYGKIESYGWDLGDDTTRTGSTVNHTYTRPGQYIVKLTVTNSLGLKNTAQATVIATRRPGPNPPANLSATAVEDKLQIDLAWKDQSDDEQGFLIERKEQNGSFAQIDSVDNDFTTYTDRSNLEVNTAYCYRVRAFNGEGESDYTNETCATTPEQVNENLSVVGSNALIDASRDITIVENRIEVTVIITAKVALELAAIVETLDGLTLVEGTLSAFTVDLKPDDQYEQTYTLEDPGNDGGAISGKIRAKPVDADSQILELETQL